LADTRSRPTRFELDSGIVEPGFLQRLDDYGRHVRRLTPAAPAPCSWSGR